MKRTWALVPAGLLLLVLAAVAVLISSRPDLKQFVDAGQLQREPGAEVSLEPGIPVGQTFVAHHGGLNGIEAYLTRTADAQGALTLHLRESPIAAGDILTTGISLAPSSSAGFYRFSFPPILSSHSRYYYVYLEHEGSGQIVIPTGRLSSYPDGALYRNHEAQESQMVFRLTYDPPSIVWDLLLMVARWIAYGLAAAAILFFSGYWIVCRWARKAGLDFTATLISSALAALAAWMVFLVWASMVLHLDTLVVWLVVGGSALLGLWQFASDRQRWRSRDYWLGQSPLSTLALWLVVILSIALRLFVGRGMVMTPGSDTYHHTLIVQLFEEQGGIPHSYQPYAPLISFSYHFGFHSIVALFRWLFGTELLLTTKTVALVLNGAIAATAALVAERWAGNRRAGVIAAAVVGLIAVSPFCLLRWGRFTQTTGMLFLAAGLLALTAVTEGAGWFFPSVLIAAMVFSHYRVFLMWLPFAAIAGIVSILQRRWYEVKAWLVMGTAALVFAAPWLVRLGWVLSGLWVPQAASPPPEGFNDVQRLEEIVLSFVTNKPLLFASILSAGLALLGGRTRSMRRLLLAWCLLLAGRVLASSASGALFQIVDLNTTLLSLAVPVGILAGLAGEHLWHPFRSRATSLARAAIVLVLLAGIAAGVLHLPGVLWEEAHYYLRPADLVTMDWIEQNVPEDALFLVNSITIHWAPGSVVGIDTGYWIPLLARRDTTVPPMVYSTELGDPVELPARLEVSRELSRGSIVEAAALGETVGKHGVTHLFVDAQSGPPVWLKIAQPGLVSEIYRQDWVSVFAVIE